MTDHAELELGLHRRDADHYGLELRLSRPGDKADIALSIRGPRLDAIAPEALAGLPPDEYGRVLGQEVFAESRALELLRVARSEGDVLRLRLFIGPSALELHSLHWELLRIPEEEAYLATSERTRFSRYMSSNDWRLVRLRPEGRLRALVVVANPPALEQFGLAPIALEDELARARIGLGDTIERIELCDAAETTLNGIIEALREDIDILYLVAHGVQDGSEPILLLADEQGEAAMIPGERLVERLHDLTLRPRLVVLASCQSAGAGVAPSSTDDGVLAALGPRLAEIGIPAVLAMQGNVLMETMAAFMPVFFTELRRDGQVDRAMAAARSAIRDQPDWWAPVLFIRLRNGQLWYSPGFTEQKSVLEQWTALLRNIERGNCTPILGPGLTESLLGSRREIARNWAKTYSYPMAAHEQDDLPQVAQYISVNNGPNYARDELEDHLSKELRKRTHIDASVPAERALLDQAADVTLGRGTLGELFCLAWRLQRIRNPNEPINILAQLPLPLYITTSPTNALFDALCDATITRSDGTVVKKRPRLEIYPWKETLELHPIRDDDPDYRPTPEEPLVYQLFGNLNDTRSVVLTEDDYFDFLHGVSKNSKLIPKIVRRALVDKPLLFLGFNLDEQDFRVLFRSVMQLEGRSRRGSYAHVAAQINPEEGRILAPERARDYLERYFGNADISIFWGSADDFIRELQARL